MKNVIIYKRVSTDEQALNGFSLDSQDEKLRRYCENNNLNIVESFIDDYSAKDGFDRPGYRKIQKFISANKNKIDGILVTQWSRFSRDFSSAINEINRLRNMNIEPNAIEQWVDYNVPESLYMRMMYLVAPQVENERLSLRTIDGMRKASKSGKWQGTAPYGYFHNKAQKKEDKSLEIDTTKAQLVKESFLLFSSGLYTAETVRKMMWKKGLTLSKQSFLDMLQQHAYTGHIKIKRYKDEPEQIVKGLHQAIFSIELFQKVQMVLRGRKKSFKGVTKNDLLPLIGHLYCSECEKVMTGSGSRGNGGVYHYYHCQRKYGCKNSIKAREANKQFSEYLISLQPQKIFIELYEEILKDEFKLSGFDRESEKNKIRNEILAVEERLNKAVMKNLDGILNDKLFEQTSVILEKEKDQLKERLDGLNKFAPEFVTYLSNSTSLVSNLSGYYTNADTETKQKLIGSIFPEKIYFENNSYRTTKINAVIEFICSLDKGLNENCLAKNARQSSSAPPARLERATL